MNLVRLHFQNFSMHSDRFLLVAASIKLMNGLLKITAACVAYCVTYQDVTEPAECRYWAKTSGLNPLVPSTAGRDSTD